MKSPAPSDGNEAPAPAPAEASELARALPVGRLRRALARIGATVGLGAVFVVALAGGAVLHLNLPVSRHLVEQTVRSVLDGVFAGTIDAQGIDHLGLDGAVISVVVVRDSSGVEVIRARGVHADASVPAILRSLLGNGDLHIDLPLVRIDQAEVLVEPNAGGQISIAEAFGLRPSPPGAPGRDVYVSMPHVEIGSAHARGRPDGVREIDGDVRHLVGAVRVAPGSVTVDVEPTGITERKLLPGVVAGTAEYHLWVFGPKSESDPTPSGTRMWTLFGGRVGSVEVSARGVMEGDHVDLTAHAPRVRPEDVKALIHDYPVEDTLALHVDVKGDLPKLDVHVVGHTEHSGSLDVGGQLDIGTPLRADLTFRTQALDPRAAVASLPEVRITSTGKIQASIGTVVSARIEAQTEPTALDGTLVPGADLSVVFDGALWSGAVKLHEDGAPIEGTFAVQSDGGVRFDVTAKAASLAKVPRIAAAKLGGGANVQASGVVRDGKLDATVRGQVHALRVGTAATIARGDVRGRLSGPLATLSADLTVTASNVVAGGYDVRKADVRVTGPVERPRVSAHLLTADDAIVDVSGTLDVKAGAAARVKLRVERDGAVAVGEIARVGQGRGGVAITGVALNGPDFGQVKGSLAVVRGELLGTLHADDVDLGSLRKLLRLPVDMTGKASADVSLERAPGGRRGSVTVSVREGAAGSLLGLSGNLTARFDGNRVTTSGELALAGQSEPCRKTIAKVTLSGGDGQLTGELLAASTWLGTTGQIDVEARDVDLACLSEHLPPGAPISHIAGLASAKVTLARDKGQRLPSLRDLTFATRDLVVEGPRVALATVPTGHVPGPRPTIGTAPAWLSRNLDLALKADVDGDSGETTLLATLSDKALLLDASFATTLDFPALLDPKRREAALTRAPLAAHLAIPRRSIASFASLPTFVANQIPSLSGQTRIDAYVSGTAFKPTALVRVLAWGLSPGPGQTGTPNPWAVPLDLDVAAIYTEDDATLDAHVSREQREIATVDAKIHAPLLQLLGKEVTTDALYSGRASARLRELPLGDVPFMGSREIQGHISGNIDLDGIGSNPSINVDLHTTDLAIGPDLVFDDGRVTIRTQRAKDSAEPTAIASVHLKDRDGGALDATGYVGVGWQAGFLPSPLLDRPADLYAKLTRFRLATLEPFVGGVVRELDGEVDGDLRLGWGRLDQTEKGTIDSDLRVTRGSFYIPQIGQKFRVGGDAGEAPMQIIADRKGELRIDRFVAKASSGEVFGKLSARLEGLALKDAKAELAIAENRALPISLEGVPVGKAWGSLKLGAEARGNLVAMDVRSSDLHLLLPDSSSRDLQALDENPDVDISHELKQPKEDQGSAGARNYSIAVHLDDTHVDGSGIRILLSTSETSPLTVTLSDRTRTTGDIRLSRGTIEVMGRKFELDQGLVRLRADEASNPYLNVTAHWDAPDGSRVFVDYVGVLKPITNDKLRFRSNPPRSQQETLALLLFGSENGASIGTGPSTGTETFGSAVGGAAVGVGGELAAQQFNQLLRGIAPLKGLSTRFATTDGGGIKTSLVYEASDTVTAAATYEGNTSTSSTTTTAGTSDAVAGNTSVSIDWRFYKNWLIRASIGTVADVPKGEVDLLWQYRY